MNDVLFSHGVRPASAGWARARRLPKPPRPAAGLLPRYTDADGHWWLLARRCRHLGGTWSNIGGSLEPDEHPLIGALREFHEETAIGASRLAGRVAGVYDCGALIERDAPYHLFVLDVAEAFDDAELGWENDALSWFTTDRVDDLARRGRLHDGLAAVWPLIRKETR